MSDQQDASQNSFPFSQYPLTDPVSESPDPRTPKLTSEQKALIAARVEVDNASIRLQQASYLLRLFWLFFFQLTPMQHIAKIHTVAEQLNAARVEREQAAGEHEVASAEWVISFLSARATELNKISETVEQRAEDALKELEEAKWAFPNGLEEEQE